METRYEQLTTLKDPVFRRLTGVMRSTFVHMIGILEDADTKKRFKGGRRPKLTMADKLLMTLEYLREYRTYLHIAKSYGVSESSAFYTIRWVEDTLVKHPDFALPGRKALHKSDMQYEVILVDATETPIERPKKKAEALLFGQKEKTHHQESARC
jgi:hypothetical protein